MSTDTPVQPGSVQRTTDKTFPRLRAPKDRTPEQVATDQLWVHLTKSKQKQCELPSFFPGSVLRFVVRDKHEAGRPWRAYTAILAGSYWTIGGNGTLRSLPMQTTENLISILRQQDFGNDDVAHNMVVLSLGDKGWRL